MPSLFEQNPMIFKGKDGFDYPEFKEIYEKATLSTWTHHLVSMESDLRDWQNISSPQEKAVIAGILRGFVASELGIGCYWANDVCRIFPKPEIQAMARAFSYFETIHASAYSYLNDTLGLNEYEEFIRDKIAIQKIETFFASYPDKVKLAVFSGAGEGVSLFASFAVLLSFNRQGRYKGLAQIISWSAIDEECVVGDTNYLTPEGWKQIKDYQEGDLVGQYDTHTKAISFVKPTKFIKTQTNEVYEISEKQRFSQSVTPNHTIIDYQCDTGEVRETLAKDWGHRQSRIPVSGFLMSRHEITPLERFMIVLQADGHLRKKPTNNAIFSFKRRRKINRFRELLKDLACYGFTYTESVPSEQDQVKFSVFVPDDHLKYRSKTFSEVFTFDNLPYGFLEELACWDGHLCEDSDCIYYSSKVLENVEFVQTAAALSGYYEHIIIQEDFRWKTPCRQYRLNLKKETAVNARYSKKNHVTYSEPIDTYCFKVPTQAFIIKHNGLISVTGNCHANGGILLFNKFVEEAGITQKEIESIYEGFRLIVNNEFLFIDNNFNNAQIESIDPEHLKSYILTRANEQLVKLNLKPIFELSSAQTKYAQDLAAWFEPLAFGVSSNDFFTQPMDGSNYVAVVSQDFDSVDLSTLVLEY